MGGSKIRNLIKYQDGNGNLFVIKKTITSFLMKRYSNWRQQSKDGKSNQDNIDSSMGSRKRKQTETYRLIKEFLMEQTNNEVRCEKVTRAIPRTPLKATYKQLEDSLSLTLELQEELKVQDFLRGIAINVFPSS